MIEKLLYVGRNNTAGGDDYYIISVAPLKKEVRPRDKSVYFGTGGNLAARTPKGIFHILVPKDVCRLRPGQGPKVLCISSGSMLHSLAPRHAKLAEERLRSRRAKP